MNCPGSRNITPEKLKVSPVTKFHKLSYEEIGKLSISIALFFTNDTKSRLATQTGDSRGPCMLSIVLGYKRINDISRQQIKRAYTVVRLDNRPLFREVRYKERDRTQESDENLANTVACTVQL